MGTKLDKNLLREEIKAILNESEKNSPFSFSSVVKDIDVDYINEYLGVSKEADIYIDTKYTSIYWDLDIDARSWGIKDIGVTVKKIICSLDWTSDKEFLTEEEKMRLINGGAKEYEKSIDGEIRFEINYVDSDWKIDTKWNLSSSIYPDSIEYDLLKKQISIIF